MESERREYINGDGDGMTYYVSGNPSGSPMIVMHGWGCDHSTIESVAAMASPTYRVFNVDFPGFGNSKEPNDVWGVEEYAKLVEGLISNEKLDPAQTVLAGHSFGGRVSIVLGSKKRYSKIVLIDSAGVKPRRKLSYYWKVYSYKFFKRIVNTLFSADKAESIIERQRQKKGSADYKNSSPKMRAIMSKVVNEDLTPLMPFVKSPTLLMWGVNDVATPLADAKKMERLIPDSGLVEFKNAGHYSFLDAPAQFRTVFQNFINN